ncbi:hypothetical protein COLO4_02866 [Corchorus olitorius]|uniref:Myb/SANT-like domain-containing protein n=1 Tax=Corchorus olitorius TaxID=93759 RepID=A0A1R3L015_9ROSI|nr:hypothetical protein COLO4_02866 [Corchorus olitorius]
MHALYVLVLIQSCFYSILLVSCVYDLCSSCTIVRVMDALVNPERPVAVRVNWTVEEEGTLLDCVSVLNVNQFLSCTDYHRLEQLFNQRCPEKNPGRVAISSKLKALKRDFIHAIEMLANGFTFNNEIKMVEGPEELWEAWLQQHDAHARLKTKAIPHFNVLQVIFNPRLH